MLFRTCRVQFGPPSLKFRQKVRESSDEFPENLNLKEKRFQKALHLEMLQWPRKTSFEKTVEQKLPGASIFTAPSTETFEKEKILARKLMSREDLSEI